MQPTFNISNEQLARELQRMKLENIHKQKQIQQIIVSDPEIKQLKRKIDASYLSKDRARQLAEKQVRQLEQEASEAEVQGQMIKRQLELEKLDNEKRKQKIKHYKSNLIQLENQIHGKRQKQQEARKQYEKQKQMVNNEIHRLIMEDRKSLEVAQEKKERLYKIMQEQYELKEQNRKDQEALDRAQLEKISSYQQSLDQRDRRQKQENARKEQQKQVIYLRLKDAEEKRQKQIQELENMRIQYYQFMKEEEYQKKEAEERQKQQLFKSLLQEAQVEHLEAKKRQKEEEQYLQIKFREKMLQKLAQQQKVEQLAREKRRMKQQQHKREVERLWQIKLDQYRQAKQQQRAEAEQKKLIEMWRINILEKEKERLIREHANNLQGFLHPDLVERARVIANYQGDTNIRTGYLDSYTKQV